MYRAVDQSRNMDSSHRTCVIGFQYMTQLNIKECVHILCKGYQRARAIVKEGDCHTYTCYFKQYLPALKNVSSFYCKNGLKQ